MLHDSFKRQLISNLQLAFILACVGIDVALLTKDAGVALASSGVAAALLHLDDMRSYQKRKKASQEIHAP